MKDVNIEKLKTAYLESYDDHADALYRFCVFQTSNDAVSQDITAETFTKTWEYITQGKEIKNIRAFLYRVAKNLIIDYRRKKKAHSLDAITETGVEFESSTNIQEEQSLEFDKSYILKILETLEEPHRGIIILRFIEELSIKEIAEISGEKPNTISVKVHRGVEKLKQKLENYNG